MQEKVKVNAPPSGFLLKCGFVRDVKRRKQFESCVDTVVNEEHRALNREHIGFDRADFEVAF